MSVRVPRFRDSARSRLLAVLLIVGLAPVIGTGVYMLVAEQRGAYVRASWELQARAADGATLVAQRVLDARTAVETVAANPLVRELTAGPQQLQAQLETAKRLYPSFEDITIIGVDERVLASTDYAFTGTWRSKPWFQEAVQGRAAVSAAHLEGSPLRLIVVFTAPVVDERGAIIRVVSGQVEVRTLARSLRAVGVALTPDQAEHAGGLCLLDASGLILAGPDGVEELARSPLAPADAAEELRYAGGSAWRTMPVPGQAWYVAAQVPEAEVTAAATVLAQRVALGVGVAAVLAILIALWLSRFLSGTISDLAQAIDRIGHGHLHERMEDVRLAEFRAVVSAFNAMAQRLGESEVELRRSEEWFRALATHASDVTWVLDRDRRVRYVGPSAALLLGDVLTDVQGLMFSDVVRESDAPRVERAIGGGVTAVEHGIAGLHPDRVFESRISDLTGIPAVQGTVISMREITERKALEADVERAIELDRLKTEFVGLASHELRTPLTGIYGFAALLLESNTLDGDERAWMEIIHGEAERLTRIVEVLLSVSRIESGVFEVHPSAVPLDEAVQVAARAFRVLSSEGHKLVVDVEPGLHAWGEQALLVEVIENLVTNAVKYSPHGGRIEVRAFPHGGNVVIEVIDEGLGIPSAAIPRLFERFRRVDSPDRAQIRGTGLGLYVVKRIVDAHRGTIALESHVGIGSRFTVTLPSVPLVGNQAVA